MMNQLNEKVPAKKETGARKFWRIVLGTMVGFFFSCVIVSILSFIMMISMVLSFSSTDVASVENNSVLKITLPYQIQERSEDNPFENIEGFDSYSILGLDDILKGIASAADDSRIKGIYLNVQQVAASPATVKEIHDALIKFKESGKFIYAYSEYYTQGAYYLSSVADKIILNTKGEVSFKGIAMQVMFFKGLLDKMDVEMQVVRHGQFKSAVEPYIMDKMSDANREQMTLLSQSLWNTMVSDIANSRHISADSLNMIANKMLCSNAESALSLRLVDQLCYKNEFETILKEKLALTEKEKINVVTLNEYKKSIKTAKNNASNSIAVVYAVGSIVSGKGDGQHIGSESLTKEIRKAYENDDVKAIVLRVNSPGGSSLASEVIWNEIELAKQAGKIIVVSMGDLAASGGYYISCNADYIVAQPNTLTGSIGVFGMIPNLQKMMKNKLGITVDVVKSNDHADYGSVLRKMDETEYKTMQISVEDVYATFTQRVADGRKIDIMKVDEIGQGRVWAGVDALDIHLVDELGSIDDAIAIAAKMAKLSDYNIVYYPKKQDWFSKLFSKDKSVAIEKSMRQELGDLYFTYEGLKQIMNSKGIQARMPMEIVFE